MLSPGFERALEHVAVAMQQDQAWTAGGDEAIHEHALAAEQNIGQPFHAHKRIVDLVRAQDESVLANIDLHSGMQRQHHQFTGGVAREGDAARTRGHADDERHAGEGALHAARQLQDGERDVVVLPQHDVMFEEDGIVGAQVNFGHRNNFAFHLTGAGAELELGHVPETRGLSPAGFTD